MNKFDLLNNKWEDFSESGTNILPYKNIRNIYPHSDKKLWLASYGSGLVFFDSETVKSRLYDHSNKNQYSLSDNDVWQTFKDSQGIYWVLTFGGGINIFNSSDYISLGSINFKQFHPTEIDKDVTKVFENSNGEILIGTDTDGLVIVDSTRNKLKFIKMDVSNPNGLTNNEVWDICKNASGGYWLGTFGGGLNLLEFKTSRFQHISTDSSPAALNNPIAFTVEKLNADEYLIGTYGGGLNWINIKSGNEIFYTINNSSIASNYITEIVIENDSSFWIGTDGKGISRFNPATNTFADINASNNNKLTSDFVKCMMKDSYNNIWVGTLKGFCNIQSADKVISGYYSDESLALNTRALLELEPGKILIGTHGNGVIIHDLKKKTFENISNPIISNQQITELFLDSDSTLWIGTRGNGLVNYNFINDKARLFTEKNGLCNNTILGIEEDNQRNLWIITNNGLAELDKSKMKFTNYFAVDGLLSNEFVQGSIYKDSLGIIYAGNIKGLEIIAPKKFIPNEFNPPIEITKLTIMNEDHSLREIIDSELELSHEENFIKIDFSSLDFTNPPKNLYRYRLANGSSEWINLGTEHSVNFANLKPDEYKLELNGSNSDGIWSSHIKTLAIIVDPPFYNTLWFYAALLTIIGLISYRFYNVKVQKKLEMERLRLKLASDLHDEVGSSLTQIAMNADLINYESDINKIKTKSELIRHKSGEMINVMNDVIWSIDSRNDKLESLIERIKQTANQIASSKEILTKFKIEIQNPNKKLNVDFRQNVFLIIKEAVNNSVKYSEATLIKISFSEKDETLYVSISDNGGGLPEELKTSGNGIKNIKHRTEKINGKIEFINQSGLTIKFEAKIA